MNLPAEPEISFTHPSTIYNHNAMSLEEKLSQEHLEQIISEKDKLDDGVDRHLAVKLPDSLVGLSDEEISAIDKRATWKLDLLLMPVLMALYIL